MIYRFTLTYNSVSTEVAEPRDWKDFKSEIKRDFKSHGVLFKYTSEALKLGFADGRDILENAFQLEGFDAVVQLSIDRRPDSFASWTNIFVGNARMESRELTEMFFNCDFESSPFIQKSVNRFKTKVKLDSTIDLDGNALSGTLTKQNDDWQTIRLDRIFNAFNPTDFSLGEFMIDDDDYSGSLSVVAAESLIYWGDVTRDNLQTVPNKTTKVVVNNVGGLNIVSRFNPDAAIWSPIRNGDTLMNAKVSVDIQITVEWSGGVSDVQYDWEIQLIQMRGGVEFSNTSLNSGTNTNNSATTPDTHTFELRNVGATNEILDSEVGDLFYFAFLTEGDPLVGGAVITGGNTETKFYGKNIPTGAPNTVYPQSFINITQLQAEETVSINSWFVYDVLQRINYIISGKEDGVYSDFFGNLENGYIEDGCGALNVITNGYQLRTLDRQLNMSMTELLGSLQALYGIGYGFEKQYDGSYKLRVEPLEFFYTDVEILDLGSPVSIKELDSYKETTSEDVKFNAVEIGYKRFNEDIGVDNIFEDFLTRANYSLPITSISGDYVQLSDLIASNDVIQATLDERINLGRSWKYDERNFIIAVVRNQYGVIPENDENFESVAGLDDSPSAYNIRHAPVYMFLNHALIINSALFGKPLNKEIQNTTAVINIEFNATFNQYEECLLGDIQRLQRSSDGNIAIENNFAGLRLFNPIVHELRVVMSDSQFNALVDSMEGDNIGYLTYRDNDSNIKQGYLLIASWSTVEGVADLRTLERADNYGL